MECPGHAAPDIRLTERSSEGGFVACDCEALAAVFTLDFFEDFFPAVVLDLFGVAVLAAAVPPPCTTIFCGAAGGASYIKSLKAPLPQIELVPTGGVTLASAASFIQAGAAAIGVGADLVDVKAIRAGEAQKVTAAAQAYVAAVRSARTSSASA